MEGVTFTCENCGREFFSSKRYASHLKRKKPCKKKEIEDTTLGDTTLGDIGPPKTEDIQNNEEYQQDSYIFEQVLKLKIPFMIDVSYMNQINLGREHIIVRKKIKNGKRLYMISIFQKKELEIKFKNNNLSIDDKIDKNNKHIIVLTSSDKIVNELGFDTLIYEEEKKVYQSCDKFPDYLVKKEIIKSYDISWDKNMNHKNKAIDLFIENKDYLEETLSKKYIDLFKHNYEFIDNHKQKNIDHFTNVYRDIIKLKNNDEYGLSDITLLDSIKKDNRVKILWGSCLDRLKQFPSESVGLMVTSPPYYNARDYSLWPNLKAYLDDMRTMIKECYRVLDNHRVFVFNVSDVVDNDKMEEFSCEGHRKIPLPAYFITIFEECGFRYIDDIIWDKGEVQSSRHKNKSKPWPFYQYSCNCYEHILIFSKHRLEKDVRYPCSDCGSLNVGTNSYTIKGLRSWECCNMNCERSESNRGKRFSLKTIMTSQEENRKTLVPHELTQKWRRDIVKINPVIKINNKKENKLGHTAPFPMEIPDMAIHYYSYKGDIVLDMFGGSFTTAISANKLDRIGVGIELRKDLFEDCIKTHIESHNCEFTEL